PEAAVAEEQDERAVPGIDGIGQRVQLSCVKRDRLALLDGRDLDAPRGVDLDPTLHMRDLRGTAAFPTTLRLGTQGEGRTEASDGGAGRAPRVDPRPREKHQHSLAPTRTGVLR